MKRDKKVAVVIISIVGFLIMTGVAVLVFSKKENKEEVPPTPTLFSIKKDDKYIQKNENAKYTFVEYYDFNCPYCKSLFFERKNGQVYKNINVIMRNFPIMREGETIPKAAIEECVYTLGGEDVWKEFVSQAFDLQGTKSVQPFVDSAVRLLGSQFKQELEDCSTSPILLERIRQERLQIIGSGLSSVPSVNVFKGDTLIKTYTNVNNKLLLYLYSYYDPL